MAMILVIDDERLLCDLLQEMLRRHGHEVFEFVLRKIDGRSLVVSTESNGFSLSENPLPDLIPLFRRGLAGLRLLVQIPTFCTDDRSFCRAQDDLRRLRPQNSGTLTCGALQRGCEVF